MVVNRGAALSALEVMRDAPVIPVIVLDDVAHAVPLARALVAGGIRMLEVTLRTRLHGGVRVGGTAHGPRAGHGIGHVARDRADAIQRLRRAQRHLQHADAAFHQRARQRHGLGHVLSLIHI